MCVVNEFVIVLFMGKRALELKQRMRQWELKAKEVSSQCTLAVDTIRALGRQKISESSLDEIEEAIEKARRHKMQLLSAG